VFACYALRCRIPDVGIIRNALTDVATVNLIRLEEMNQVLSGANLLFVGWEANNPNWDQTAGGYSLTFDSLMERVRQCPAFQNVPILLVTDEETLANTPSISASGFTGILTRPLERETIRQQTAEALGEVGRRTILGPAIKSGLAAYTVKCLPTDRVVIQNALGLKSPVIETEPEALETAQPTPEIVFLRWGAAYPETKYSPEERKIITGLILNRICNALTFRDIPVILLANRSERSIPRYRRVSVAPPSCRFPWTKRNCAKRLHPFFSPWEKTPGSTCGWSTLCRIDLLRSEKNGGNRSHQPGSPPEKGLPAVRGGLRPDRHFGQSRRRRGWHHFS
jgi:hypothetical protein